MYFVAQNKVGQSLGRRKGESNKVVIFPPLMELTVFIFHSIVLLLKRKIRIRDFSKKGSREDWHPTGWVESQGTGAQGLPPAIVGPGVAACVPPVG